MELQGGKNYSSTNPDMGALQEWSGDFGHHHKNILLEFYEKL